jgi:hypothetical protein
MRAAATACVASPKTKTRLPVRYVESIDREYHGRRPRDRIQQPVQRIDAGEFGNFANEAVRSAHADRHGVDKRLPCALEPARGGIGNLRVQTTLKSASPSRAMSAGVAFHGATTLMSMPSCPSSVVTR